MGKRGSSVSKFDYGGFKALPRVMTISRDSPKLQQSFLSGFELYIFRTAAILFIERVDRVLSGGKFVESVATEFFERAEL